MGKLNIGEGQDYGNPGDSIPAKLPDGSVVNAIAATPINNATVLVAITDDGQPYAFNNPSILSVPDRELSRSSPPRKPPAIALDYPFKVLVEGTGISVQGFDEDANLANSDGYTAIGLTNTGDGYVAIAKSGDTYLFDVDGGQTAREFTSIDFDLSYVPYLGWYGNDVLLGQGSLYPEESTHVYNPSNTNQNVYWSNFFNVSLKDARLSNYIAQVGVSKSTTETWTQTTPNQTPNNCYVDFSYTYNHYVSGEPTSYEVTLDYYEKQGYPNLYYHVTKDSLTKLNDGLNLTETCVASKSDSYTPSDGKAFHVVRTITELVTESYIESANSIVLTGLSELYPVTKTYSREREYTATITYNIYQRYGYYWAFRGTTNLGDGLAGLGLTNVYDAPTQTLSQVIGHPVRYYEGTGVQNDMVYSVTTTEKGLPNQPYYVIWAHDINNNQRYDTGDWYGGLESYKVPFDYGGYPLPTLTTTLSNARFELSYYRGNGSPYQGYDVGDPIYYTYAKHNSTPEIKTASSIRTDTDNYTSVSFVYKSDTHSIFLYETNLYNEITNYEEDYYKTYTHNDLNNINSGGVTTTTYNIQPTTVIEKNYTNPTTIQLTIKSNDNYYDIKDFDVSNGFNFNNRFYAFAQNSITEPTLGVNVFTCTVLIGLHSNNKGNYQNIIKQNKSTTINNATPSYQRTYHSVVTLNLVGLGIDLYWISSGIIKKYAGTITNASYTTSTNSTTNETTRNYTGLTVNLVEQEDVDFICHGNNNENGIFITASNNYTRFLLEYITSDTRQVNCYEQDGKMRIAIAKTVTADNIDGEDEWFADIYEFDTVNKKFIRIGNESGSLSEINGDQYNFISYYPA